ncbi:tail fiber protein, partial [Enterobacter hormaechei]
MSGSISGVSVQAADSHKSLITDVQFYEMYTSTALNRKFKNIIKPGIYSGFNVLPGAGLKLVVTSGEGVGAASIDFEKVQLSVQQHADIEVEVSAGTSTIIALQGFYKFGVKTSQVSEESTVNAAEIVTITDQQLKDGQIEICRVVVPAGSTQITLDMIDTSSREYRSLGIQLSAELDSEEEGVAANSLAIKRAISFLLGDGVPETLATLSQLAAAINNDANFAQTVNKALGLKAPLASPALTGTPTTPTPAKTDNSTKIASTAFVQTLLSALQSTINDSLALKAPLGSPALTGTPTAPTAAQTVNNTQLATTAFVKAAIASLVDSSPAALDTLKELAEALGNDPHFATTVTNALAGKQPLNSTLTDLSGKTVAGLLEYLGLGEAAKFGVGSNANQLPDMTYFSSLLSSLGYQRLP